MLEFTVRVPTTVTLEVPIPHFPIEGPDVEHDMSCECRAEKCTGMCSPVYYRIILDWETEARYRAVCLQDFDECDYDQRRFLNTIKYKDEDTCLNACAVVNLMFGHSPVGAKLIGQVDNCVIWPMVQEAVQALAGRR